MRKDKGTKKSEKKMTKKRAKTLVKKIREFVETKLAAQIETSTEGTKTGQLAQALDSFDHEGVD